MLCRHSEDLRQTCAARTCRSAAAGVKLWECSFVEAWLSRELPTSSAAGAAAEDVHPGGPCGPAPAAHAAPEPAPQPAKAAAKELLEDALRLVLAKFVPTGASWPWRKACSRGVRSTHWSCVYFFSDMWR